MRDRITTVAAFGEQWEIISDWRLADVAVSTIAAVDAAFADFGNRYKDLCYVVRVTGVHAANFQLDHTEDPAGVVVEDLNSGAATREVPCAAGKQATIRLMDIGELGWRLSAYSSEGGNPSTTVNRRILGRRRT